MFGPQFKESKKKCHHTGHQNSRGDCPKQSLRIMWHKLNAMNKMQGNKIEWKHVSPIGNKMK